MSMVVSEKTGEVQQAGHFDSEQIAIIKESICKGATDSELQFFLQVCKRTGLDPFSRQIYSIPRGGQRTIQVGIDGLCLIADRTGKYMPGKESVFGYTSTGAIYSCTAYIKKQARDGSWHEVSAIAFWDEYNAGQGLWKKMPRRMLEKCALALCLRKAFPSDLSGLYTHEEMDQADVKPLYNATGQAESIPCNGKTMRICISQDQADELSGLTLMCKKEISEKCWANVLKVMPNAEGWYSITPEIYQRAKEYMIKHIEIEKMKAQVIDQKDALRSMDEVAQQEEE